MFKSTLRILIVFLFILHVAAFAQKEKHFIGGSFGLSDFHLKDIHASPLIFSGWNTTTSMQYYYNGEIDKHYVEATYSFQALTTLSDNLNTVNDLYRLRYSYVHSLSTFKFMEKEFNIYAGGSISTFLSRSNYYQDQQSQIPRVKSIKSWYWSNSIDMSFQLIHNPYPRQFFSLQIYIPLISNVSRPKYSPSADFNYPELDWKLKMFGETVFITDNFSVNTIFVFQSPLFWKLNYQFSYEFYFSAYSKPKEVKMYMNCFRAGLFFCL